MKIWLKIFLVFMVFHGVQSKQLVVNTTCLELAKTSRKLTCSNPSDYHCLLDETFTKEFEVCREWKWIPGGKCAYFNTYGSGNVDERKCAPGINVTCSQSKHQFESNKNTQFSACYVKKMSGTSLLTTTSPIQVTSKVAIDGDTATSSPTSKAWIVFLVFIAIAVISLPIFVIFFILGYKPLCKKVSLSVVEKGDSPANLEEGLLLNQSKGCSTTSENNPMNQKEDPGTSLSKEGKTTDNPPLGNVKLIVSERNEDHPKVDKVKCSEDNAKCGDSDKRKASLTTESTSSSCYDSMKSDDDDSEESTKVFNDTVESLQRTEPPADEEEKELCTELYNRLHTDGCFWKLSYDVMASTITRTTKMLVSTLLNSLTDQDISKLKEELPKELHRILETKEEREKSIHILYALHKKFLDKPLCPKSGWGNPIRGKDIGIGDDVERLNRIQTIVRSIQDPVTVSVESYIRLIDIMVEALTRLDSVCEFKKNYKTLASELTCIKKQTFTQKMIKDLFAMW